MTNEEHLAILMQGVEVWNAWRESNPEVRPEFEGADLSRMHLQEANFFGANFRSALLEETNFSGASLEGVRFDGAYLQRAILFGTHLKGADFRWTDLQNVDFSWADLEGASLQTADLEGADLSGTDLTMASLEGTNFQNVLLSETIFANTDLSGVIGLETVIHNGPSRIDVDTLYKSRGKIPEVFLRGCGVPDSLIEYLPSLIGATQSIQFYSCFISYSTHDDAFAQRLHSRMQQEHLRVWFAPEELKGGHKLRDQIDDAIRVYDKLLLILSDASMASDWVAHEIRRAHNRERAEGKRVLFPIRLCDFESLARWELYEGPRNLASDVREYFVPDFSHWKDHDAFETAFAQLLKALRANEKKATKP